MSGWQSVFGANALTDDEVTARYAPDIIKQIRDDESQVMVVRSCDTRTRGDDIRLWHFEAADAVLDTIVVRELWQVPWACPAGEGADEAAWKTQMMFVDFMDFAGDFIWKYCEA